MNDADLAHLSNRVARLERATRRWQLVAIGCACTLALALFLGAAGERTTDEVRAKTLVLVGPDGKERVKWGPGKLRDSFVLRLLDRKGEALGEIGVNPDVESGGERATLSLGDGRQKNTLVGPAELALLGVDSSAFLMRGQLTVSRRDGAPQDPGLSASYGSSGIHVMGKKGASVSLGLIGDPESEARLTLQSGLLIGVAIGAAPDGSSSLRLWDNKRKTRGMFEIEKDGSPSLTLHDPDGTIRAVLGQVELQNTRTGSGEMRPASSLVLFDKAGKVLWNAP